MPLSIACRMEDPVNRNSSLSKTTRPSYVPRGYTPERIFISVALPAPFSPQMPWIDLRRTPKETRERAVTPGKLFVTLSNSRMVSLMLPRRRALTSKTKTAPEIPRRGDGRCRCELRTRRPLGLGDILVDLVVGLELALDHDIVEVGLGHAGDGQEGARDVAGHCLDTREVDEAALLQAEGLLPGQLHGDVDRHGRK